MLLLQLMIVIPDAARNLLRLIKSELYGVQTYDPLTFFAVLALLIIAATAATFLPPGGSRISILHQPCGQSERTARSVAKQNKKAAEAAFYEKTVGT